eukprot:gene8904-11311_t
MASALTPRAQQPGARSDGGPAKRTGRRNAGAAPAGATSTGATAGSPPVDLREHGSLEIDDGAAWHAALQAAGTRAPLAQQMQTRWTVFVAVLAVAALLLGAFYRWGTPWAATQLTRHVPTAWETSLAERAMQQLDDSYLKPSKLPPERQAALKAGFDALAAGISPALRRYP